MQIRDVRIAFDDPATFLEEYERNLSSGWVFVPSESDFELGEVVEVTLDLLFCGHSVRVLGVVKSRIGRALAQMLERTPGAVVEFADGIQAFEEMIRDTLEDMVESTWTRRDRGNAPRRSQRVEVAVQGHVDRSSSSAKARTHNLSPSGALLEVAGIDLQVGDDVSLSLVDPATGKLVALSARVIRHDSEDAPGESAAAAAPDGTGATPQERRVAVEFARPIESDARKARFLEQVRAVTAGPRMGGISGNLSGLSLPSLLQSIATSSERGTMEIVGDGAEAHILFESNALRHASVGRIVGLKALARLMEWPEGEFSFQPTVDPDEPETLGMPVDVAVREAARQAEELAKLSDRLLPDTVLIERAGGDPGALTKTEAAVLEALARPGCPSTLLDTLPDPDAEIWRALLGLLERDVVRLREDTAAPSR